MIKTKRFVPAIVLLAMLLPLVGCGGNGGNSGSGGRSEVVTYADSQNPVTEWDPAAEFSEGVVVLQNVYESLLRFDPVTNKLIPVLATSYSKSSDGKVWTFRIRKGVKFHDGTNLNAEAVKFSIERTINLGKGASYIWAPVKSIDVVDDYTVRFTLNHAAPLGLISASAYGAYIVSPTAVKKHPQAWLTAGHEAGTGPYMLQTFVMGQPIVLTKFEQYWKGWSGKHFTKVVFDTVPEASTRRQLLQRGDADVALDLPSDTVSALQKNPSIKVYVAPAFQSLWYYLNTQKKPLNNVLVRQALSYAFPYAEVVKYVMGGAAVQSRGPVPTGLWGNSQEVFQYTYDLKKARELLAQAGYPKGGFTIDVTYDTGDEAQRMSAELFRTELAKLGITLQLRGGPFQAIYERAQNMDLTKRQYIFQAYWWLDVADPYSPLEGGFVTKAPNNILWNVAYYSNKKYDELIAEGWGLSATNRALALKKYIEAQQIVMKAAPVIFAYDQEAVWTNRTSLKGFVSNPAYAHVVFFYDTYREGN